MCGWSEPVTRSGTHGFGVVETLIVLVALGIAVSLAVPVAARAVDRARVEAAASEWLALSERARLEARVSGSAVMLCPVADDEAEQDPLCGWTGQDGVYVASATPIRIEARYTKGYPTKGDPTKSASAKDASAKDASTRGSPLWASSEVDVWRSAMLYRGAHDERILQHRFDPSVAVRGDKTPIRYMPPAGRIAGRPRHFEIAVQHAGEADGADRADGVDDPLVRRCVLIAASGRARIREGICDPQ